MSKPKDLSIGLNLVNWTLWPWWTVSGPHPQAKKGGHWRSFTIDLGPLTISWIVEGE